MELFLSEQQVLFKVDSLCDFQPYDLVPWGGARGQNLGHLGLFLIFFLVVFIHEIIKQKVLFRVYFLSVTLDYMVQCPRVGLGVKI